MLAFLGLIFLLYGGMHYYALGKVWQAFPHSAALGVTLALWGLFMTFAPLAIWYLAKQNWHGAAAALSWVAFIWMGYLFLFCCIALALDITHLLADFARFKWPLSGWKALLGVALPALALTAYATAEARQLRVDELKITTPKLASGRATIAQISDLHLGMMLGDSFLERVIEILREAKPDIIVATGDVIDGEGDNLAELAPHFRKLSPHKGVYAILGNHENFAGLDKSLRFFQDAGFITLRGESIPVEGIILAGVDDRTLGARAREMSEDKRQALAAARKDIFVVLLKHQPIVSNDISFDLQLSGHAHGGQIFPFGLFTLLTYGVRAGLYRYDDGRMLYINRGTGTWGPPMRLFAPPEITLITIESKNNPGAPR
jgi:predicted MPP superfamily phosphohydrolase